MINFFLNDKYDNETFIIKGGKFYSVFDFKKRVLSQIEYIKNKNKNMVLLCDDNYSFLINFIASVFLEKEIYILSDKTRINDLKIEYDILDDTLYENVSDFKFKEIDFSKGCINFFTSGTTSKPKQIKKSIESLIEEANDVANIFNLKDKNLTIATTTSSAHSFGLTFNLILPLFFGFKFLADKISYPENLDIENVVLISSPSFLGMLSRHNLNFTKNPSIIFSAGSKLNEDTFNYLSKKTETVDIYGSTETGVIGYRRNYNEGFSIFNGIKIENFENYMDIKSDYVFNKQVKINDSVDIINDKLYFKNRTDRLFKINDKRVSMDEIEYKLNKNDFVYSSYVSKIEDNLICLCSLTDIGKKYFIQEGIYNTTKKIKQDLLKITEIAPKRWKFIDEIPMTQNGKVDKKVVGNIFNTKLSLPLILNRKIEENSIEYEIFFYKNCDFFKGHFPEFKIVPGVVQLYYAKLFSNVHFNLNIGCGQLKRIKFSNYIQPDDIVNLRLEKNDKQVTFEYFKDDKSFSKGVIPLENVFGERQKN